MGDLWYGKYPFATRIVYRGTIRFGGLWTQRIGLGSRGVGADAGKFATGAGTAQGLHRVWRSRYDAYDGVQIPGRHNASSRIAPGRCFPWCRNVCRVDQVYIIDLTFSIGLIVAPQRAS